MSFALYRKSIHCPNCHYEGSASLAGNGAGMWVFLFVLVAVSLVLPVLWLAVGLVILVMLLRPAKQVCPSCKHPHPVPLAQWQRQNPPVKSDDQSGA